MEQAQKPERREITQEELAMMYGQQQNRFGVAKYNSLPDQCLNCEYEFACHGECPRNRFVTSTDGEQRLNYLCKGYYRFFDHAAPYMDYMRKMLQSGQAPARVMKWAKSQLH